MQNMIQALIHSTSNQEAKTIEAHTRNIEMAVSAGMGMLIYELRESTLNESDDERLQRIWKKMWQLCTGYSEETSPDYFG